MRIHPFPAKLRDVRRSWPPPAPPARHRHGHRREPAVDARYGRVVAAAGDEQEVAHSILLSITGGPTCRLWEDQRGRPRPSPSRPTPRRTASSPWSTRRRGPGLGPVVGDALRRRAAGQADAGAPRLARRHAQARRRPRPTRGPERGEYRGPSACDYRRSPERHSTPPFRARPQRSACASPSSTCPVHPARALNRLRVGCPSRAGCRASRRRSPGCRRSLRSSPDVRRSAPSQKGDPPAVRRPDGSQSLLPAWHLAHAPHRSSFRAERSRARRRARRPV